MEHKKDMEQGRDGTQEDYILLQKNCDKQRLEDYFISLVTDVE